jgi:prepilin-type N-terminal cleavage/methylation domain-containing protein
MKSAQYNARSGFTLLEIMFVVGLMSVLSGMVMTTFLFLNRAAGSMTAYRSTHAGARHALMVISDDIRAARTASVSAQDLLLLTRQGDDGPRLVGYRLDGDILRRRDGGADRVLCYGISDLQIGLMTREGKPVSESGRADMVRVTMAFVEARKDKALTNTFSVVTAMRNAGSP